MIRPAQRITVLMACHNRRDTTLACLDALFRQQLDGFVPPLELRVLLVDDGSTDGTSQAVADRFPQVEILPGSGHLYWCGGMRVAFARALETDPDDSRILWLNDDTILNPDALRRLLDTQQRLREERGVEAIVAGSVADPDTGRLTYGGLRKYWALPFTFPVKPKDRPRRCRTHHGNCVLVPALAARTLGNLDPDLTHSRGDIDYGLRAGRHGIEVWICAGLVGTCRGNPIGRWRNLGLPLSRRLESLYEPKYAMDEKKAVARRHYGLLWFLSPLALYVYIFLSHPIGLLTRLPETLRRGLFFFGPLLSGLAWLVGSAWPIRSSVAVPALFAVAAGLLLVHLLLCVFGPPSSRREAQFTLFGSVALMLGFALLFEWLGPQVPCEPTPLQRPLQRQFERRNQETNSTFRHTPQHLRFDELGFPGDNHYLGSERKIVFVGDSFLELRSSKNAAILTNDLLRQRGMEVSIVNLSVGGTDLEDYRHRVMEVALTLEPEQIFVFVYEGNDLGNHRFRPYEPMRLEISSAALERLRSTDLPSRAIEQLASWHESGTWFTGRAALFDALGPLGLDRVQSMQIQLALSAYACPRTATPSLPKALSAMRSGLNLCFARLRRAVRPPKWRDLMPNFEQVYAGPSQERLGEIARIICRRYLSLPDSAPCLDVLERQDPHFRSLLVEQADMVYYLLPAVRQAVTGDVLQAPVMRGVSTGSIKTATAYARLLENLSEAARAAGSRMTVVMIPEASYGDEEFRRLWLPLMDFRDYFRSRHEVYTSLVEQLDGRVPVLDLGLYADEFDSGYWSFDGHWNGKGNDAASQILARAILAGEP